MCEPRSRARSQKLECTQPVAGACVERCQLQPQAGRNRRLCRADGFGGRTELALSIFGNPTGFQVKGDLLLNGQPQHFARPEEAINAGIAYVTEDCKSKGLILIQDVKENITLANLQEIAARGVVDANAEVQVANEYRENLNIKTPSVEQKVRNRAAETSKRSRWGNGSLSSPTS